MNHFPHHFSLRICALAAAFLIVVCLYPSSAASAPAVTNENDAEFTGEAPAKAPSKLTSQPASTNATPKKATPPVKPKVAKKSQAKPLPPPVVPPPKEEPVATQPPPAPVPADPPPKVVPVIAPIPPAPVAEPIKPEPVAAQPPPPASPAPVEEPKPTEEVSPADQEEVVVLTTSLGDIVIALDTPAAPRTCKNFRHLVKQGFYDHTAFHRVIPNFMIQGGDPNSKGENRASYGQGGPGYTLPAEILLKHNKGAVAMARLPDSVNPERESNGSQFYICVADCPTLDDNYTVFGHVLKGMDVVEKIANEPRDARDNPNKRIEIEAHLVPRSKAVPAE